jgi:hypothetical protein
MRRDSIVIIRGETRNKAKGIYIYREREIEGRIQTDRHTDKALHFPPLLRPKDWAWAALER